MTLTLPWKMGCNNKHTETGRETMFLNLWIKTYVWTWNWFAKVVGMIMGKYDPGI